MNIARNRCSFIIILLSVFYGCNTNNNYYLNQVNYMLNYQKSTLKKTLSKDDLLSHFPEKIKNDSVSFSFSPPSCPPIFKCRKQFGEIYIIVNTEDYREELSNLFGGEIIYKTFYSNDDNIIINLMELRKRIFNIDKCNRWYFNKFPIPYFEHYDFGLGEKEKKVIIKEDNVPYYNYIYNIPSDLEVYVIKAEVGNFWKESCNENRPIMLKDWKNGYSRGFSISKKEKILIFWTIVW